MLGLIVLLGSEAFAQPSPSSPPRPPPQTLPRVTAPPPPPPPAAVRARLEPDETGAYLHDGFYMRFGLGAGYVAEPIDVTVGDYSYSYQIDGVGVPIDFALGGTLGKGFVLGGVLYNLMLGPADRSMLPMPDSEREEEHAARLSALGLLGDWYVDPASGFHIQGMLAGGSLALSDTADSDYTPTASVVSLGVGYSFWIGPDSSAGILARVERASLLYEDDDTGVEYDHQLVHVGLMGTVTYH